MRGHLGFHSQEWFDLDLDKEKKKSDSEIGGVLYIRIVEWDIKRY
jgi:hypothetical protein